MHTITNPTFEVGGNQITPLDVMHYKLPILAYRIGDFTYITDAKTISEEVIEKIKGTKVLVLNALQKESHISHLTFDEAIAMANRIGAETTYFTHISHNLGLHQEVSKELPAHIQLAYDGLKIIL